MLLKDVLCYILLYKIGGLSSQKDYNDYFDEDFDEKKNCKSSELIETLVREKELKSNDKFMYNYYYNSIDIIDKYRIKNETDPKMIKKWIKEKEKLIGRKEKLMKEKGTTPKTPIRCATVAGSGSDMEKWIKFKKQLIKKLLSLCVNMRISEVRSTNQT